MWKNSFKTLILMTTLAGMLMLLGTLIGGSTGLTTAFIIALVINGIMFFFSDRIVLALYKAQPLNNQRYPDIEPMVRSLATMDLPMPRLWIIETPVANAFATGRNPRNGSVAFTTGILSILGPHELRGVIAHELSHIYHRDILITTIAATLAMTIGYLCNMLRHVFFFRSNDRASRTTGLLITTIFMPLIATLVRLGISRSREYLADEQGARACQDPLALASALEKLHSHTHEASFSTEDTTKTATAGLFIVNPFSVEAMTEIFSTHPPLKKRVIALQRMHHHSRRWHL
jgi:heat shock protein HtpX